MKFSIGKIIISLLALAASLVSGCSAEKEKPDISGLNLLNQVRDCSKIYTGEYQVSKIIVETDEKRMKGKILGINVNIGLLGGRRIIALPVKGVFKSYVDLAEIGPENIRRNGNSIEIILPDPMIILTSSRISSDEIREKVGFMQKDFSDSDLTRIQQQGRDSLIAELPRLGLIENARLTAARTLIPLLVCMGYDEKDIRITFSSDASALSDPSRIKDMIIVRQ